MQKTTKHTKINNNNPKNYTINIRKKQFKTTSKTIKKKTFQMKNKMFVCGKQTENYCVKIVVY